MGNIVSFALHVGYQVDVSHDQNLESFLAVVHDNGKYEIMIRVGKPLIEERGSIKDGQVSASLNIGNYL